MITEQLLRELVAITIGIALFIVRKKFARTSIESQNKSFGFSFGQKEVDNGVAFLTVASVAIVIAAIVSMLRITNFRI